MFELPSALVLNIEIAVPLIILMMILAGYFYPGFKIRPAITAMVMIQAIAIAFRPIWYNSDTENYSSYVYFLSLPLDSSIFFITKIEPLHVILISLTREFRLWALCECALTLWLIYFLHRRVIRLETYLIIIGTSGILLSSSLRFAIGILIFSAVYYSRRSPYAKAALMSVAAASSHVVHIIAGPLSLRKAWISLGALAVLVVAVLFFGDFRSRAGGDLIDELQGQGLKSFACLAVYLVYGYIRTRTHTKTPIATDMLMAIIVYGLTLTILPYLNRWLIVTLVVVALDYDWKFELAGVSRRWGIVVGFVMYAMLTLPFVYSLYNMDYTNHW